jgi:hypothetical protein
MRIAIIAAMAAISFGCIGISGASSAPASGTAIQDRAAASNLMQKVEDRDHKDRDHKDRDQSKDRDRGRDHKHCHWRHWHRVCD